MNRWELESIRGGLAQELKSATDTMEKLYADTKSTVDTRTAQKCTVADIKERLEGINGQIKMLDDAAAQKLQAQSENDGDEKDKKLKSKAAIYRATMRGENTKALADNASTGGGKFLPKTVVSEIVAEPTTTNPLRAISTITNIENLEIPKIAFALDDDEFVGDGETAKEITKTGDIVTFKRNKFKVFVDVSETVISGTDANLVSVINSGLESGLAKKEKKSAFAETPTDANKHMSFYSKTGTTYDIKAVDGGDYFAAITNAMADLEEDYRDNATIVMRFSDYLGIIQKLANGNATLYGVQPNQVLGKPVVFCDMAIIPIVGDFSYSHYNYDGDMLSEHDKNVKTGMESFVLTAWLDHQIKLRSAFRLAVVKAGGVSQP